MADIETVELQKGANTGADPGMPFLFSPLFLPSVRLKEKETMIADYHVLSFVSGFFSR